ncbi:hypothetical protein EXN48_14555 [Clostridium botulinum]|nr:hypothetical protein [Clostridium botulinum]NFC90740.1 hypothetical protein [Clostridium botulinum]NFC99625.1 hypothetical protein [Clostridium botulinum]NFD38470.1 hypothetical protein [Clostridium botulinum]NFD42137.1 hypothetical protein [Clostridium botulinum]
MKSFIEKIYFGRDKEENWDIEEKAERRGFKNSEKLVYLGYEVEMEVREDLKHKVLKIDGVDVSDKDIYI